VSNRKGRNRNKKEKTLRGEGGGELDMVSTISFIQTKLQHSIAVVGTGILVSRELNQGLEYSMIYPVLCGRNR
jgi:hypothetical protein